MTPLDKESIQSKIARIRKNVYEEIDHKQIHRFLEENLGDFDVFIKAISEYLG